MSHTYSADGSLPAEVREEFARLQRALNDAQPSFCLQELHAEPARLRTGLVVLADGTDWDPGSGAGIYGYYGSAWVKLG